MANEIIWESGTTPLGHKLTAEIVERGFIVTVKQRQLGNEDKKPAAAWFVRSQLMLWWPTSIAEAARVVAHHCAFYDQALPPLLSGLFDKLSAIPEAEQPKPAEEPPKTPQTPPN